MFRRPCKHLLRFRSAVYTVHLGFFHGFTEVYLDRWASLFGETLRWYCVRGGGGCVYQTGLSRVGLVPSLVNDEPQSCWCCGPASCLPNRAARQVAGQAARWLPRDTLPDLYHVVLYICSPPLLQAVGLGILSGLWWCYWGVDECFWKSVVLRSLVISKTTCLGTGKSGR